MLQAERWRATWCTRSGHSTYNPPPRSLMWWSSPNSTQSPTTPKKPADETTAGCDGLCSTRGGSSVGAAGVRGKVWAGGFHCPPGWPQPEGPSWTGGPAGEPDRSASPKQSGWPKQQRSTWRAEKWGALVWSSAGGFSFSLSETRSCTSECTYTQSQSLIFFCILRFLRIWQTVPTV